MWSNKNSGIALASRDKRRLLMGFWIAAGFCGPGGKPPAKRHAKHQDFSKNLEKGNVCNA
jgi:hypothetical protein